MPTIRDKIYVGDSFPVAYECRKPDPSNPDDPAGLPVVPTNAYARVLQADATPPVFLELGGPGVFQAPADITDNVIAFTLTEEFTTTPGNYKIFITGVFPGGARLTENRNLKILDITN